MYNKKIIVACYLFVKKIGFIVFWTSIVQNTTGVEETFGQVAVSPRTTTYFVPCVGGSLPSAVNKNALVTVSVSQ
jgi:hypothetical protein